MSKGKHGVYGKNKPEMIGQKFGRLLVLSYDEEVSEQKKFDYYLCQCDCGKKKVLKGHALRTKNTKSCGCLRREMNKEKLQNLQNQINGNIGNRIHGFCTEIKAFCEVIRARDKVCQRCGKTKKENGESLSVHHLDGDKWNNKLKNGTLLCRSCHSIITCYKNVWRPNHADCRFVDAG